MEISIHSYLTASAKLVDEPNCWDVILILDSGLSATDYVDAQARRSLILHFDDIEKDQRGKRMVTADVIKRAFEFSSESNRLLVTCRAGQSRSASLGFAIACKSGGREVAENLLNPKRHSPNKKVIELADFEFPEAGIYASHAAWRKKNEAIRMIDFLDEIAAEREQLIQSGERDLLTQVVIGK